MATVFKLGFFGLICGIFLGAGNYISHDRIIDNEAQFKARQLHEVIGTNQLEIAQLSEDHYQLLRQGEFAGQLFELSTEEGYNGEIRFWLAINESNEVLGVRVIAHRETPGLGDKLERSISDWVLGFNGKSLQNAQWDVKKFGGDFDAFSGATITPRAVIKAIEARLAEQVKGNPASGK